VIELVPRDGSHLPEPAVGDRVALVGAWVNDTNHSWQMTRHGSSFDPTRITSYVVSGVGFLGAGVIISDGVSVRGINTAATLWCAAAVGALSASGFIWQAALATAAILAILAINILLRPLGRRIDRQPADEDTEIETTYRFRATTRDDNEAHVRALLLRSISGHGYQLRALESADIPDSDRVEVKAELVTIGRNDQQIETAAGRLGLEPSVTAVRWQVVENDARGTLDDKDHSRGLTPDRAVYGVRGLGKSCG
jgi:putative Mg2+ transporter-C (MgtC) family protein